MCADYDEDGDTDIFVANDVFANFLYRNDGKGGFRDVGLFGGFAYDGRGTVQGSMGVDCGDYDNDGKLDFHVTSYQDELATLYRNGRNHVMVDVTTKVGIGLGTRQPVTWGNAFVDLDNDGDQDIFIASGHLGPNVEKYDGKATFRSANTLMENLGDGKFKDISSQAGSGLAVQQSSRGIAFDDLDGDGDLDGIVLNTDAGPTLLRNDSTNANHWIGIRLQGRRSNLRGVGAQVRIESNGKIQTQEVHSGRGYQSHYGQYLHFGLGQLNQVDNVSIRWVGGKSQTIGSPLPAGKVHTITEQKQ